MTSPRQERWCVADVSCSCEATFAGVRLLAERLKAWCATAGVSEPARMDLELALVEAGNNIVRHGYGQKGGDDIGLEITAVAGGVELVLTDRGSPIPQGRLNAIGHPEFDSESGRGLALITACTDRIAYTESREGNRLVLFKALP